MAQTNVDRLQDKHTENRYHLPRFAVADLQLFFGYYDGNRAVVEVQTQSTSDRRRRGPSQGVVLRGDLLHKICAAALYLTGHDITPGLRTLGLRTKVNGSTTSIDIDTKAALGERGEQVDVHAMVSTAEGHQGLRFWIQCGPLWQDYALDRDQTIAFLDRLSEASDWPIEEEVQSERNETWVN